MDTEQKNTLLHVARDFVTAAVKGESLPVIESDDPELDIHCGCFVTLKNNDQLRGCLGQFTSERPLIELIAEMAVSSATRDPRFLTDPITADELDRIDIEISVLSPLQKTDDALNLRLGTDGIFIKKGHASGCFLPQVATETGWSKEEFLSHCCAHKAGLSPDAWKDPQTEVYLFTAQIFGAHLKDV